MDDRIVIVDYDSTWPEQFKRLGTRLREALGPLALRIDHIGSTGVPGLAAKPILDVQISVASLEPVAAYLPSLEAAGFAGRPITPSAPSATSARPPGRAPTFTSGRQAAGRSSSPC